MHLSIQKHQVECKYLRAHLDIADLNVFPGAIGEDLKIL